MSSSSNIPKYDIGDIVFYNNKLYYVNSVYPLNWFIKEPHVYGLFNVNTEFSYSESKNELFVREGLLRMATEREKKIWKILYDIN